MAKNNHVKEDNPYQDILSITIYFHLSIKRNDHIDTK